MHCRFSLLYVTQQRRAWEVPSSAKFRLGCKVVIAVQIPWWLNRSASRTFLSIPFSVQAGGGAATNEPAAPSGKLACIIRASHAVRNGSFLCGVSHLW